MSIIAYRDKEGTINVLLSGKVSRDAELRETSKGSIVKFSVCYGKKKYMDCEAWADSDVGAVAGCLEKGDTIEVSGIHRSWVYNEKNYESVTVDMIKTLALPTPISEQANEDAPQSNQTWEELSGETGELPF